MKLVNVGSLCNYNCINCEYNNKDKSFRSYQEIIREINEKKDENKIVFYGGEPTLHKDIIKLIYYSKKKGYNKISIITNGQILKYEKLLYFLINYGLNEIKIKFPAFYEETYKKITKTDGLKDVIQALENIKKYDLKIVVQTKVCKENKNELIEIISALKTLQIDEFILDFENFQIDEKIKNIINEIILICRRDNIKLELKNDEGFKEKVYFSKRLDVPKQQFQFKANSEKIETGADPRIVEPEKTIQKAKFAINDFLINIDELNKGYGNIYIFKLNRNFEKLREYAKSPYTTKDFMPANYGKGNNEKQALASGLIESIERTSALCRLEESEKIIKAKYEEIQNYAINPNDFFLIQDFPFYNHNGRKITKSHLYSELGDYWTWAYSLTKNKHVLVPASLVYFRFHYMENDYLKKSGHSYGLSLGAGNCYEEAIIHGINELMESEAMCSFDENFPLSKINKINSFSIKNISSLSDEVKNMDDYIFCFHIKSNRFDFPIHIFFPTIFSKDGDNMKIISGIGCNLNPINALNRGITELFEQSYRFDAKKENNYLNKSEEYKNQENHNFSELLDYSSNSIHKDYLFYKEMIEKNKLDLIVKDLTDKKFDIPVVRVLIPGMKRLTKENSFSFYIDSLKWFKETN
jgi:thiazole/oxazole-forming peptide maturase SagD family component